MAGSHRIRVGALAFLVAVSVAGCAPGEIGLEGKVFDYLGVGANSQTSRNDPKLAPRTGLVLPPSLEKLPQPGSGEDTDATLASLDDPDRRKSIDKSALEKKQAEYCKVHYEQAKARGDGTADAAAGPLGPCRASIWTAMEKINKGE